MQRYYALNQMKSVTKSKDIQIHIYKMPVFDVEKIHQENGQVVGKLKKQNGYQIIGFYQSYIASFEEIKNWEGVPNFDAHEFRSINLSSEMERSLLERVILRKLESTKGYRGFKGVFVFEGKEYRKEIDDVIAKRTLHLDIYVNEDGDIYIGFELTHRFFRKENIFKKVINNTIDEDTEVMDIQGKHFLYKGVDKKTVSDPIEVLGGRSILEYFEINGRKNEVKDIEPDTPVVLVANKNNESRMVYYAPQMLFEACTFAQLPTKTSKYINSYIKLDANSRMRASLDMLFEILDKNTELIQCNKGGILVKNQNCEINFLKIPMLLFGKGRKSTSPFSALKNGQIFGATEKSELTIHFFAEDTIVSSFKNNDGVGYKVRQFIEEIKTLSLKLGVELHIHQTSKEIKDYTNVSFQNIAEFKQKLKSISSQLQYPTVVVASEKSVENCYETLKKECARHNIPTQVVTTDTLDIKESTKIYALLNILLGIYAKAGIQPWVLAEKMHSDCYIGLDVSHENGRHSTGIVQIVGRDGRVLDSGPMSSTEAGEIIRSETIEEIVANAVYAYEKEFQERPKHITIHRDGNGHDVEIKSLQKVMGEYNISFDYISVVKDARRRMCVFIDAEKKEDKKWETELGLVYSKKNVAFLTATNPRPTIGTAKPIRITQLYGNLDFKHVIQDIYSLSYMHIGALNKSRLPITIHYADLSSTYYNRGLIPNTNTKKSLHFL